MSKSEEEVVGSELWRVARLAELEAARDAAKFDSVRVLADAGFPAEKREAIIAALSPVVGCIVFDPRGVWPPQRAAVPADETPLDRNLREIDEAFAAWKKTVRDCRDGNATPEDVKRFTLALLELIDKLDDLMPYSENA